MKFAVLVEIESVEGIADPEGLTIERALPILGFSGISQVHVGKVFRFFIDASDEATANKTVQQVCDQLLANPVIEQATVHLTDRGYRRRSDTLTTIGIVNFPGSNCELDVGQALANLGATVRIIWHQEDALDGVDGVVIPGGFAHGDYLRPGAIARFSPIMNAVSAFAAQDKPVIGICNGFQVLAEAGLLPGALTRNEGLRFICDLIECEVASSTSVLTSGIAVGTKLALPINHGFGNFACTADELAAIEQQGQIVLRYCDNPNGSVHAIAGVANRSGNVVGLMPHPERASNALIGSADGVPLLQSFLKDAEDRSSVASQSLAGHATA